MGFNLISLYLSKAGGEMDEAKLKVLIVEETLLEAGKDFRVGLHLPEVHQPRNHRRQ